MQPLAIQGTSPSQPITNFSTSISLSIFDENGNDISLTITTSHDYPIEFFIPRDSVFVIPKMILQNVSSIQSLVINLFVYILLI